MIVNGHVVTEGYEVLLEYPKSTNPREAHKVIGTGDSVDNALKNAQCNLVASGEARTCQVCIRQVKEIQHRMFTDNYGFLELVDEPDDSDVFDVFDGYFDHPGGEIDEEAFNRQPTVTYP